MTDDLTGADRGETSHPMEFLLDEDLKLPVAGEIRKGWVVAHHDNHILVDIGAKSEGIISGREIVTMDEETRAALAEGNQVTVCVLEPEDQNGNLIVSYAKAAEEEDWKLVTELLESQETCQSRVVGFNRGGLLAKVGALRGFVPNSQISRDHFWAPQQEDDEHHLQSLIGDELVVKVIEVDRERNRLILSERAAEREAREARRAKLLESLETGEVREGRVVNLADFGAFVDIGGIEGLVHVSELSWKRVSHPSDVLEVGDEVKVSIINVDEERQRLALSIKRLEPDPWSQIEAEYHVGQLVEATITKLTKFGAFARIQDEYELVGLIHISELAEEHVDHPRDVVRPSQTVMVRIIRIDPEQHQLGLSLKQVTSERYLEADLEKLVANDVAADYEE